MLDWIIKSP